MELTVDQKVKPAPRTSGRGGEIGVRFLQHADKYNAGETAYFSEDDAKLLVEVHGVGEYLTGPSKSPEEPNANSVQYAMPLELVTKGGGEYQLIDAVGAEVWSGKGKTEANRMKAQVEALAQTQPLEAIGAQDGIIQPNTGTRAVVLKEATPNPGPDVLNTEDVRS